MLLSRGYKRKLIDDNIEKALLVPRDEAIKRKVRKEEMDRVVMYHPALPSILRIIAKGYRAMVESDPGSRRCSRSLRWSPPGEAHQSQGAPTPGPECSPKTRVQGDEEMWDLFHL